MDEQQLKNLDEMVEKGMGYVEDTYDPRTFLGEAFLGGDVTPLPDEYIIDVPFVTNQGQIPSCTGHAVTTAKWAHEGVRLSPRFNYAWSKYNDGYVGYGTSFVNALDVVCKRGAVQEVLYPDKNTLSEAEYTNIDLIDTVLSEMSLLNRAKSYVWYERKPEQMMRALMTHKAPLLVGLPWYQSYNRIGKDGMLPDMTGNSAGHAVVYVGWKTVDGKRIHKFQNSFGEWWGDSGCFYMTEDMFMRLYSGVYGLIDISKEDAQKADAEFKQKNKIMMNLQLLKNQGTILFQETKDTGTFYVNTGEKLLKVADERAGLAALTLLMRANGKPVKTLGVTPEQLEGLTIENL